MTVLHRRFSAVVTAVVLIMAGRAHGETLLERGTYLMRSIVACGNCHTPQGPDGPLPGMELAGGLAIEDPAFVAYSPNITPDPETGIGTWTDKQIAAAIRDGRRPDGTIIGPPMPFGMYRNISDRDVAAIIAYLRAMPAVRNKVAKSDYSKIKLPPSWGPPAGEVADIPTDNPVRYGAYLAGPLGHCLECHTPMLNGRFDFENRLGAGGLEFHGPWGVSQSANITPHQDDGIGRYSDDEVKAMITTGIRPDGSRLMPPMGVPYYANISNDDLNAIVAYLRTLKPLQSE
jgi:mono/diheme cytochrome c family protein